MAKRPRFSRWRRLPGVYRFGDQKPPDPDQELQRLSVYLPWSALDHAEEQARTHGFENAQEYCTEILRQSIEAERVREQVAEVEAKRGPLEGLNEIAADPDYLAELSEAAAPAEPPPAPLAGPPSKHGLEVAIPWVDEHGAVVDEAELLAAGPPAPASAMVIPVAMTEPAPLSAAAWVVLRHAGQAGDDPYAFLPCLRRGEAVPAGEVAELAQALHQLEVEHQGMQAMDRRLTFALHRLAFESQILHTDAWPGTLDTWTVDMLRAVQEAVERILSGQDIRYFTETPGSPQSSAASGSLYPRSETLP